MNPRLAISKEDEELILSVLVRHLPADTEVFFFGSRINETHKRASDLDILIRNKRPIPLEIIAIIREEFENSDLPYKVDIVDDNSISPAMRKNIFKTAVRVMP